MRRSDARAYGAVAWLMAVVGCGGPGEEPKPPSQPAEQRDAGPKPPATGPTPAALPKPEDEPGFLDRAFATTESGIEAKFVDLQLHYAGASKRVSQSITGKGLTSWRVPPGGAALGLSLLVEATNRTPTPLLTPTLEGVAFFETSAGGHECKLTPQNVATGWYQRSDHLSLDPTAVGSGREWLDEPVGGLERLWRPGETIRFAVHEAACATLILLDLAPTRVVIRVAVGAKSLGAGDNPAPRGLRVELPAEAIHGSWVALPTGERAFVASDLVLRPTAKGVERSVLAELGLRPDTLAREPLGESSAPWESALEELRVSVAAPKLTHWSDAPGSRKNTRLLELPLELALPNAAIEARLGGEVEAARTAAAADPANDMLKFLLLRAEQGARGKLAYERARLGRAARCGELAIATTLRAAILPQNRVELAAGCAGLVSAESTQLVARFELQRYEVPVFATLPVGAEKRSWPLASRALATHDPR